MPRAFFIGEVMAVSHRRWGESYPRPLLCVNFVNLLYLG